MRGLRCRTRPTPASRRFSIRNSRRKPMMTGVSAVRLGCNAVSSYWVSSKIMARSSCGAPPSAGELCDDEPPPIGITGRAQSDKAHNRPQWVSLAAAINRRTLSRSLAEPSSLSVFVFESTPAGRTAAIAAPTFSASSPPARIAGTLTCSTMRRLMVQSCVRPSARSADRRGRGCRAAKNPRYPRMLSHIQWQPRPRSGSSA
jgi:hypothetical protein